MGNPNWETPDYFFKRCEAAWGPFGLDAAADEVNSKCELFMNEGIDALNYSGWEKMLRRQEGGCECKNIWLNPPFVNLLWWVEKAVREQNKGLRIVILLPNDTDTKWFHYLSQHAEIYLTIGRIKFIDPEGNGRSSPRQGHLVAVLHPPVKGITRPTGVVGTIKAGE